MYKKQENLDMIEYNRPKPKKSYKMKILNVKQDRTYEIIAQPCSVEYIITNLDWIKNILKNEGDSVNLPIL